MRNLIIILTLLLAVPAFAVERYEVKENSLDRITTEEKTQNISAEYLKIRQNELDNRTAQIALEQAELDALIAEFVKNNLSLEVAVEAVVEAPVEAVVGGK